MVLANRIPDFQKSRMCVLGRSSFQMHHCLLQRSSVCYFVCYYSTLPTLVMTAVYA